MFSWFKSKSNKRNSDENEAGPSKRFKKDDSSMIKDDQKASKSSKKAEVFPSIKKSFNTIITSWGISMYNKTQVVYNVNCTREPMNIIKDESLIIVQKTVSKEVFRNDKEIIQLIWKYLSFDGKKDCTLVCNRFNDIISNMNCFRLVLKRISKVQIIPKVSRNYKKLIIQGYHCNSLSQQMHEMLKHLGQSVTDLTLDGCEFDIIVLSKFLCELPLLESLEMNVFITKDSICELCGEDLPNLKQLKDFNIKPNDKLNEILVITGFASNIQSLTLFDAIFDENIITYLTKYKNSLTSLSLTECIMDKSSFMSNLNSLHFDSNVKISTVNFESFNCLNKLRKLELININNELLGILRKKWTKQLTECTIIFKYKEKLDVDRFFTDGFYLHFQRETLQDFRVMESFRTPRCDDQKRYFIKLNETDTKMIEYLKPKNLNPTVDNNNNMIYFKVTSIIKNEDFLMNRRNNPNINPRLWQDISNIQARRMKIFEYYCLNYVYAWKKEYDEWFAGDREWYKEIYKCYMDDEWYGGYEDWCGGYDEWCREYYDLN